LGKKLKEKTKTGGNMGSFHGRRRLRRGAGARNQNDTVKKVPKAYCSSAYLPRTATAGSRNNGRQRPEKKKNTKPPKAG